MSEFDEDYQGFSAPEDASPEGWSPWVVFAIWLVGIAAFVWLLT